MTPTRVVFADFDGTIAEREPFVDAMRQFAPEQADRIVPEMIAGRISLREGVTGIVESVASADYPALLDSVRGARLRRGFEPLLDFLDAAGVPLVVVSGGLRDIIEIVLGPLTARVRAVHAVDIDASGERLRVGTALADERSLVAKPRVMAQYPADEWVAIGDSLTDFDMARAARVVFARGRLAAHLDEQQIGYEPWHDFIEVRDVLEQRWTPA